MAAVKGRDTKPELILRRALHGMGFRYRLNVRKIPGSPDLVLPARNALLFVHGCFWHGHDCGLFVLPKTRSDFWLDKIGSNQLRDRQRHEELRKGGWRIGTIWECAMRGRHSPGVQETARSVADFLRDPNLCEVHVRDTGAHGGPGYPSLLSHRFGMGSPQPSDDGSDGRETV